MAIDSPRGREVLIRTAASGVCHSDLHLVDGDGRFPLGEPYVLGHEGAGVVEAVGDDVTYVLIAKWTAKEGEESAVRSALEQLAGPTRAEEGCLMWQPQVDVDDPPVFVIYEQYVDAAALEAHSASEHFKRIALEDAIPRLESRERAFYETFAEPGGR